MPFSKQDFEDYLQEIVNLRAGKKAGRANISNMEESLRTQIALVDQYQGDGSAKILFGAGAFDDDGIKIQKEGVPLRWTQALFQYTSYLVIKKLFEKAIASEITVAPLSEEYDGKKVIDIFVEDLEACKDQTVMNMKERAHIKSFLSKLQKKPQRSFAEADKHPEPKSSRLSHLWHNHWRSVIAIIFGIVLVILAFTPAGPALAAALALKAVFAPVFAWIANIGLAGIGLGFGLLFSGFALALPSWITGMLVKAVATFLIRLFLFPLNFIKNANEWLIEKFNENKIDSDSDEKIIGKKAIFVGACVALPLFLLWTLEKALFTIELILIGLAEFASRTLRKLGAWQARLLNNRPVADANDLHMLTPTKVAALDKKRSSMSELFECNDSVSRASFYDHVAYILSSKSKEESLQYSHEINDGYSAEHKSDESQIEENTSEARSLRRFIELRALWLRKDSLSTGQNPYDAAEEAAEKNTASPTRH